MASVTPPRATGSPPSTYEVGGPSTAALEAPFPIGQPLLVVARQVTMHHQEIRGLCIRAENLVHGHGTLVRKMEDVSDAQVDDGIAIGELRPRVTTLEGRVKVLASQHDGVTNKVVEVEEQVLKMQDKVDNYPCEQISVGIYPSTSQKGKRSGWHRESKEEELNHCLSEPVLDGSLDIHPHRNAQTKATKQKSVKAENLIRLIK
ncbi:hypothetical protein Tco_0877917 [Tanacetum coccineum]|uniref:Uncharacterized protein n=1 Tax=Tanacetum coccineum TaxID=301880 RepID=A0ABQ5BWV0_9ASTR